MTFLYPNLTFKPAFYVVLIILTHQVHAAIIFFFVFICFAQLDFNICFLALEMNSMVTTPPSQSRVVETVCINK